MPYSPLDPSAPHPPLDSWLWPVLSSSISHYSTSLLAADSFFNSDFIEKELRAGIKKIDLTIMAYLDSELKSSCAGLYSKQCVKSLKP